RGLEPTLHRVPVAVEAALVATADLFRRGVADTIVVDCAPALPPVDADPDALERILTNLVSNAVKYSPPGSEVRLCAPRSAAIVKRLTTRKVVEIKDEAGARGVVRQVLVDNILAEEKLEADARQLLLEHAKKIKESAADYRQLLGKVKEKLARERGFIL